MDNQDYNNQNTNGQDFNQGNDNPVNNQGYDNQQNYTAQPQQPNAQQNYTAQPQQPNVQQNYTAQPQNYAAQQYNPNLGAEIPKEKQDGKAIASMVLGIVSLVCCGGFYACPIVGLILGIISKKNKPNNNGMAVAGIVMCCIALGFMVLYTILMICGVIQYPFTSPRYGHSYSFY